MSASLKRTVIGSLAALAVGVGAIGAVAPASAAPLPKAHGSFHPGGGHGAHFGHGGGNWRGGGWGPAAVGLGVLGLAAGAAIAAQPGYYDGDGCQGYRPVYDGYGHYMGQRLVNVC